MQGVTLLDVLHSLDPFRMKCLSRIVLEHRPSGYSVRMKFATTLETGGLYEIPDLECNLTKEIDASEQIEAVHRAGLCGALQVSRLGFDHYVSWSIRTHADARAAWMRSIQAL
jgi:hypothetical protein